MSASVDLFEDPSFILRSDFDPYRCSVLGIKIGMSADELTNWEGELNEANWFHVDGGVAFQVKDNEVCKIKLPRTIFERLEVRTTEDLITHLGKSDDVHEMRYRERLRHCGYLWNKGIYVFWEFEPKLEPQHIIIFDPGLGFEQSGEMTYTLLLAKDCLNRQPSFRIPPREESEGLKSGDKAKVIFYIKIDAKKFVERMWIEVSEVKPEFYQGLLASDAYCTHDLKRGTPVQFHADHIIEIIRK